MFGQKRVIPTLNHAINVHRVCQQMKYGELLKNVSLITLEAS